MGLVPAVSRSATAWFCAQKKSQKSSCPGAELPSSVAMDVQKSSHIRADQSPSTSEACLKADSGRCLGE